MIIRPARPADVDVIMAWRRERAAWLAGRGEDQWSIPLPRSAVEATVAAGQTWMAWDGSAPAATITLTGYAAAGGLWKPDVDPEPLWYPEDDPADALYAAKMMVPLERAGYGLGDDLLDWAGGRTWEAGLTWIRLDAWTGNERLHAFYLRRGFAHVRTVASRVSGACFQRRSGPYRGRFSPSPAGPGPRTA
ncbi:GCN5 family acetyltransferase [Actinoplanes sp. NPDC051851]|uniref:GCN5 family acetyltransferase n=1 Tax=Actinoplanes sp. NPDC051851 TaxID=3154753 RepID=UPI003423AEF8